MKSKSIKTIVTGLLLIPIVSFSIGFINPTSTFAVDDITTGYNAAKPNSVPPCMFSIDKSARNPDYPNGCTGVVTTIANTALFILGSVAVLMLIYGGIRYTISGGDEKAITSAKNTILYAVIGIFVAVAAYAIVNFVIGALKVVP